MAVLIKRLRLLNYKSIRSCDITFSDVTFLAGPNGAGKSNVLDALCFLRDAVSYNLEKALLQRGGFSNVCCNFGNEVHHESFCISMDICINETSRARYTVEIARGSRRPIVNREFLALWREEKVRFFYDVSGDGIKSTDDFVSALKVGDRTNVLAGVLSFFSDSNIVSSALDSVASYKINPENVRSARPTSTEVALDGAGEGLPNLIRDIRASTPKVAERIDQYVRLISPGYLRAQVNTYGSQDVFEVIERIGASGNEVVRRLDQVSDGTLRSLAIVAALLRVEEKREAFPPVLLIEEPEIHLHPGGLAVLMDAIFESAKYKQIISTTHSPDLLDHTKVQAENLIAVSKIDGETVVDHIDEASRDALRERLMTAGELLRANQIYPSDRERPTFTADDLFRID